MPRPNSRSPENDPAAALGAELCRIRVAAGYASQESFGSALGFSRTVIGKAESGDRPPTDEVYTAWLDKCGSTGIERHMMDRMLTLARKANGPIPRWFEWWLDLERRAEFLRIWCPTLVPGLLQTDEYAHAIYTLAGLDDDEISERVTVRLQRQEILDGSDAAHVVVILDESVLHLLVGTPATMVAQHGHLLDMSERRNITLQVVRAAGYYPGLNVAFHIASGDGMPDTLLVEAVEDQTTDNRAMVRKAVALFEKVRGRALTTEESRAVIMEAIERWKSQ